MSNKINLSVAIATFNEEKNIGECLKSVDGIADEIVVIDGSSTDRTAQKAREYGAKVIITQNNPMFHINKQKSFDESSGEWILYLDADERVSKEVAEEIKKIISLSAKEIEKYEENLPGKEIFLRHQRLLEERDGKIGTKDGDYVAFFMPRLNFFLGKYLRFGGVYPDGVIRFFKKDKAYLPCKDVHEQMVVKGKVGWLQNDLIHMADPTLERYLTRNNRYIELIVTQMKEEKLGKNIKRFIEYIFFKPVWWFLLTTFRHKGILDGYQGMIFSFFSALRFPRAYIRYLRQ